MTHIHIPKGWELPESDITPESVFLNRRDFLKAAGFLGAATVALAGCAPGDPEVLEHRPEANLTPLEKTLYPARRNLHYKIDRKVTAPRVAGNYNNYYEFSETKEDVGHHARALPTRNWTLEVEGLVNKPQTFAMEDLLKLMPLEERFYRMRCVEAWAMVVPWTGFPLKALLDKVEPQSTAKYVEFSSFYMPFTAQGQLAFLATVAVFGSALHCRSDERDDPDGHRDLRAPATETARRAASPGGAVEIRIQKYQSRDAHPPDRLRSAHVLETRFCHRSTATSPT